MVGHCRRRRRPGNGRARTLRGPRDHGVRLGAHVHLPNQTVGCQALYRCRLYIVKTIVMKKLKIRQKKSESLVDSCCEESDSRQSWLNSFMKKHWKGIRRNQTGLQSPYLKTFKGAQESIPSLSGREDSPICRIGPPGYIPWHNWFLGIDSWAP
jgi:hypothetical protein